MNILAVAAALLAAGSSLQVFGLTISDLGTAAPDSSNFYISQTGFGTSAVTNRTSSLLAPGQSFTTGAFTGGISGMDLTSVVVREAAVGNGVIGGGVNSVAWTLSIGTISGSTFTVLGSETVTPSSTTFTKNHYLDLTLSTPVALTENTQYAFEISTPVLSNLKYIQLDGASGGYADGSRVGFNRGNSSVTTQSGDTTFYIETVPVPEPANWAWIPVLGAAAFFGLRRLRLA
jgi:hypothetical protein